MKATAGCGDGVGGEEMEDVLAVPSAEGADFIRVVDGGGCVSRVFRSSDCAGLLDVVRGVLWYVALWSPNARWLKGYGLSAYREVVTPDEVICGYA